jgi:hypothetical protein
MGDQPRILSQPTKKPSIGKAFCFVGDVVRYAVAVQNSSKAIVR